jgi:hypothetical protein
MRTELKLAAALGAAVLVAMPAQASWSAPVADGATYANARFGFTIQYPRDLFPSLTESDNSDGATFHTQQAGVSLLAWGSYNALDQTPADIAQEAKQDCRTDQPVPYQVARANLVAVSCLTTSGDIFYRKTLIHGDVLTSVQMTYPAADRGYWDPICAAISGSLHAGEGSR